MHPGVRRIDITNAEDVQYLLDTGLAWRSGPQTLQRIFAMLQDGKVARRPERETPQVKAYLDKVLGAQPVEPADVTPAEPPVA